MPAPETIEGILERAGCPIHYWLSGPEDAPLIIFSHGATMDHRMFDAQVPAVADRYRLLTWDLRGHGRSRPIGDIGAGLLMRDLVEDLLALLDHLGYRRASLVGQSLGGSLAQEVVFARPDRVDTLAVVGAACNTIEHPRRDRIALRLSPVLFKLWPEDDLRQRTARDISVRPEVQEYAYNAIRQLTKEDILKVWNAVTDSVHHEPGYRIEHPLLITHGEHDDAGNIRDTSPQWAARDPRSRYVVIPDAGHNANQDNPEFFNELLTDFLDEFIPGNAKKRGA